jgi:NADP-dependent 3-hydroxy acid dehydrogenase YdfG
VYQGIDLLFESIPQALERCPELRFVIIGGTAEQSYSRMIALVRQAETQLEGGDHRLQPVTLAERPLPAAQALPLLRGALARAAAGCGAPSRWLLDLRGSGQARQLADDARLVDWADRGVATPDHVIRTKARPLVLPPLPAADRPADLAAWQASLETALADYIATYRSYFERQNARVGGGRRPLDPLPRLLAIPGLGLVGLGRSAADAAVTADIAEAWARTLLAAEAIGRFEPVHEDDTFDMEYWSLEQAKLGKGVEKSLARHVVIVTGGAGAIGAATALAFAARGADLAVLDLDAGAAAAVAARCGARALGLACDVTDGEQVRRAFEAVSAHFGGVDIVVSNAGAAWTGAMASLSDADLRACFELNFFAHQSVAQAAVAVFGHQDPPGERAVLGGQLLFNASKQALNPGPNFGAYGISNGRWRGVSQKLEFSGTFVENWSFATSLFGAWSSLKNNSDFGDRAAYHFDGASIEVRYRAIERSATNPFALTLAVEPRLARIDAISGLYAPSLGAEFKAQIDAPVADRLYWAANANFATGRSRDPISLNWSSGSDTSLSTALTYELMADKLFLGAETRWQQTWRTGFFGSLDGQALFVGPTVAWKPNENVMLNVAFLPQVIGKARGMSGPLDLDNFERANYRVKLAIAF